MKQVHIDRAQQVRSVDEPRSELVEATPPVQEHTSAFDHIADIAFWSGIVVGSVAYLIWDSRLYWYRDDWDYLGSSRSLDHNVVHSLLAGHGGEWDTVQFLIFRGLEATVHLHSYLPYAIPDLAAQVGIVILLRRIMRREGVGAVLACLLPLCVFFLAVAYEDIIFDDLVGMLGSVFFALLAIEVIADIDQPKLGRLVIVGVLCILSVMSSNAGFGMLVAVVMYLLLRHGWQSLTFLAVVPAALAFVMWYFSYGLAGGSACPANSTPHYETVPLFAASALEHSLDGLGAVKFSSVLIVAVGVFGFVEKCRSEGTAQRLAWSVAAVIGTAMLYLEIAGARNCFGLSYARQPRYAYFGAVLLAPIVGYGLERLARRWSRGSLIIACALVLVVALNFNSMRLAEHLRQERTYAGAVQLAVARQDQERGLKLPVPLSAVNPQVHQGELDDLVEDYGLDLYPIPPHPPTGVPGE